MDGNDFRAFERDDPRIPMLLDVLRAQYLAPPTTVPPAVFRDVGRRIIEILIPLIVYRFLPRGLGSAVIVLPWRAALLFGEVYRAAGTTFFWHIGAKRHEQTLATELYHESEPPLATRTLRHIICDPMLATGGTTCATIARLLAGGVKPWDIAVQSIIAAPEGAFRVTMEHPGVRIFTCALDERLDRNGYIVPGLGDFGDLAFADLDDQYVQKRWLDTGLLTRPQAELVLERTQAIRGSAHAS
ncbi:hypothetical protein HY480_02620 [Candidatus Uhrbacteria bacterium]|nr:hypothetical protein [Candidatus Uhrbacteria bacterium]